MSPLIPCAACSRHVRASEAACPFCATPVVAVAGTVESPGRLGRAAMFAFRTTAAVALTTLGACSGAAPAYGGPPVTAEPPATSVAPTTTIAQPYGAPPEPEPPPTTVTPPAEPSPPAESSGPAPVDHAGMHAAYGGAPPFRP